MSIALRIQEIGTVDAIFLGGVNAWIAYAAMAQLFAWAEENKVGVVEDRAIRLLGRAFATVLSLTGILGMAWFLGRSSEEAQLYVLAGFVFGGVLSAGFQLRRLRTRRRVDA